LWPKPPKAGFLCSMKKTNKTTAELKIALDGKAGFLLVRFNRNMKQDPDDLDILVRSKDFPIVAGSLKKVGYKASSHDHALGGRKKGYQLNFTKQDRIKIDLHKDFTWRSKKYLDINFVWNAFPNREKEINAFLIMINWIFEKSYVTREDYDFVWSDLDKVFRNKLYQKQARKYKWEKSFALFKDYYKSTSPDSFPKFLPIKIVAVSFYEKFHPIAFFYYLFFRARYLVNKTLPYE